MKTCSFIGHRKIENVEDVEKWLKKIISKLIACDNVTRFLLGSGSQFNSLCEKVLLEMKEKYPHIERVYVRIEYHMEDDKSFVCKIYDDSYFPKCAIGAGKKSYVVRNRHMIDESDIIVFYFDENYTPKERRSKHSSFTSGTQVAFDYALRKKKNVINLFK